MIQKKKKSQWPQTKIAIPPIARNWRNFSKHIRQVKTNISMLRYLLSSESVPSTRKESFCYCPVLLSFSVFSVGESPPESDMTQRYWLGYIMLCEFKSPKLRSLKAGDGIREEILIISQAVHCIWYNLVSVMHRFSGSRPVSRDRKYSTLAPKWGSACLPS